MGKSQPIRRGQQDKSDPGSGVDVRRRTAQQSILHLQRAAGNQAVARLLARQPSRAIDPDVLLKTAAHRADLGGQVRSQFQAIEKLREERINDWEGNAEIPKRDIGGADVLGVIIAIVSEGIGGVVYGLIEEMMTKKAGSKLVQEFASLAGLEAGDLAAESVFHNALSVAQKYMEAARLTTQTKSQIKQRAEAAIVNKKGNYAAYAEAMRLQMQDEEHEQNAAFAKAAADKTDEDLIRWDAALDLIWQELFHDPKVFLRELTVGYTRLIDEAWLADKAKEGEAAHATRERVDEPRLRPGSLLVITWEPVGRWENPDLSFPSGITVRGEHVNDETLDTVRDAQLREVPVTMSFAFSATSPYNYWNWGRARTIPKIFLAFVRDPDGNYYLTDPRMQEDAKEWLASYYTRQDAAHTDNERDFFAPFGAKKLYEAIKTKRIVRTETI
jgi:hypothetical protein